MQRLPEIRLCVEETGGEAEQRLLRRKQVSHAIPSGGSSPPLPLPSFVRVKYSSLLPGSENRGCKSLHKPLPEPQPAKRKERGVGKEVDVKCKSGCARIHKKKKK